MDAKDLPQVTICQKCLDCNVEELQAKLDGYEGGILEPLQERYKIVCDENVILQAELEQVRNQWHIDKNDKVALEAELKTMTIDRDNHRRWLLEHIEKYRWKKTEDVPDFLTALPVPHKGEWLTYYEVLQYEAEIPVFMTAAHIWLDEHSEAEWYRPIILPDQEAK